MGGLPQKGTNGTLWNVMGPARNREEREMEEVGMDHGKNRRARRRLVTLVKVFIDFAQICIEA